MRRRFFWSMVAVALVTLVIGGLTASVLVARSITSTERAEYFRQAAATGSLIEAELPAGRDLPARQQLLRLERLLAEARVIGGHDYVEAVVVFGGQPRTLPADAYLVPALTVDLLTVDSPTASELEVGGEAVTALVRPLGLAGDRPAWIVVGRTDTLVPWGDVFGRLMLALIVAVALASLLAVGLSRSLGRRLDGLAAASRSIADGDLTARAPDDDRGDQVTQVAWAFNDMATQLEDAARREQDFLMSVSHDLRTPLTTIRGYAEGLADDAVPTEDLPRVGTVLHTQADRLSRLVEDLVLLSRLEARQFTLRPEPVDLAAHLKEVADTMRPRADEARVRLVADVSAVGIVDVDPDRIAQVAGNLLENALRYTPEGGAVTLRTERRDGRAGFSVADTGPGIDPADQPHVFERLYVAQRYRAARPEGSGLGLSIVKEIVDAMGGAVAFDSTLGRGTTVSVWL